MSDTRKREIPKSYKVFNPYNIPVHNQGNKNNCTSHSFSLMIEYQLSDLFKERVIVDVDDLWEKQKKFGTATEERGDVPGGVFKIARKYGVRFITARSVRGIVFVPGKIILDSQLQKNRIYTDSLI